MTDRRELPVPEGLAGERLDAALSRLFGFSRTRAAELVGAGDVLVDGAPGVKSDRVRAGAWLDVVIPPPPGVPQVVAEPVPGMTVVYDFPLVRSPVAVVFEPLAPFPKVTVLILWALASAMNCE